MSRPFFKSNKRPIKISNDDVVISHACPRILLVAVKCSAGKFAVVSLHAPDQSSNDCKVWWTSVTELCSQTKLPIIACGDVNASMPDVWAIRMNILGESRKLPSNIQNAPLVAHFLDKSSLWMPASDTCSWHNGQSAISFVARGCRTMNDYIFVSSSVSCVPGSMYAWNDYDSCNRAGDHIPTVRSFEMILQSSQHFTWRRRVNYDRHAYGDPLKTAHFERLLDSIPLIPFSVEPTSHYHLLEEYIQAAAIAAFPIPPKRKKSQMMSDITFQYVLQRGELRKRMRHDGRRIAVAHAWVQAALVFSKWVGVLGRPVKTASHGKCSYALWDLCIDRALCSLTIDHLTDVIQQHVSSDFNTYVVSRKTIL